MNNGKFIRGKRAELKIYEDYCGDIPQEIIDKISKPFIVIGDENTKFIIPQQERPIKLISSETWEIKYDSDDYTITFSRPATDEEKREILNDINKE